VTGRSGATAQRHNGKKGSAAQRLKGITAGRGKRHNGRKGSKAQRHNGTKAGISYLNT